MQYLPALQQAGFEVTVASLFDDAYLQALYSGRRDKLGMMRGMLARFGQCHTARNADVIWLEKEALPWLPWGIERLALPRGVPIVSDFDDAIFHNYDLHSRPLVRRVLGSKIDRVMARSVLVTAGNPYLANRARQAGAPRVEIVPTVVDAKAYMPASARHGETRPRIGWIGTPQTWAKYGSPRTAFFQDIASSLGVRFQLVGARVEPGLDGSFDYVPWTEAGEVAAIQDMDIGIMPLDDSPWERGKCGYKLIQYMACGLPVVAPPVGVNSEIVTHGETGFLASTEAEWRSALSALVQDPTLRRTMGEAGRKRVVETYSIQAQGPRVAGLLEGIVRARNGR
ncbi:MAG: glycosyltransferase family 4 protein [Litorimonas sp.]